MLHGHRPHSISCSEGWCSAEYQYLGVCRNSEVLFPSWAPNFRSSINFLGSFKRNPAVWWPVAALSCSILFRIHIVQMCYGKTGAGGSRSAGLDSPDSDAWIGAHWVWEGACVAPCAQGEHYGFCSYVGKGGATNFFPPSRVFPKVLLMCFHLWVFSLVFQELGSLCLHCFVLAKFACHHSTAMCSSAPPGKWPCSFFLPCLLCSSPCQLCNASTGFIKHPLSSQYYYWAGREV